MPLLDMPLEKLRTYKGTNPKPADFDRFWSQSLDTLDKTFPNVELVPATFEQDIASCFHLYFDGVGGARIHAKLLVPKGRASGRGILHFHGYTGRSDDWSSYLGFAATGAVVAAMDCRGQAGRSEDCVHTVGMTQPGHVLRGLDDGPENLYYRQVYLDTVQLSRVVASMPEVDANRLGTYGGSQGGALSLACSALNPSIQRCVATMPFLSDFQRVWEMDQGIGGFRELVTYFRNFDPLHEREAEVFRTLGYIDVQHLASRIRAEVRMATGLMDRNTPPSACFAAYNKIKSKKDIKVYPDFAHEGLPGFNDATFKFLTAN